MAHAPLRRTLRDPLAEALFPVLIHRLNNATQLLSTLTAALDADLDEALLAGSSDDLAGASRGVRELGWLLGVLASAGGADLLLERRERGGLDVLVRALRDGLRRRGRDLAEPREPLPELVAEAGDGWQVPWALGSVLWHAGALLPDGATLGWTLAPHADGWRLVCAVADGSAEPVGEEPTEHLAARLTRELPGATLARDADGLVLGLPAATLRAT